MVTYGAILYLTCWEYFLLFNTADGCLIELRLHYKFRNVFACHFGLLKCAIYILIKGKGLAACQKSAREHV